MVSRHNSEPSWSRTRTFWVSSRRADHYAKGSSLLPVWCAVSGDTAPRAGSDLAGCQRSIEGRTSPHRRARRSLDTPDVGCQPWIRTTPWTGSKPDALPLGELAPVAVGPEGLEPSPLRVKAAFSASRDPGPRSSSPPPRSSSGPRGHGPLTLTLASVRSSSRFVFYICSFCFRGCIAFD